jgi:hypothetical protein|tara:strand:+ start:279 stop:527 length:249 start_codon:yes stop_codon:yes gene_type:complete
MREMILQALKSKISGQINGHIANIEAMMSNPVGIGDHPTIVETIEKELSALEHENGKLNNLVRFFERPAQQQQEEETTKAKK